MMKMWVAAVWMKARSKRGLPKDGPVAFSVEQRTIPALFLGRWRYLVVSTRVLSSSSFQSNLMP
jgi:hypothetical protein